MSCIAPAAQGDSAKAGRHSHGGSADTDPYAAHGPTAAAPEDDPYNEFLGDAGSKAKDDGYGAYTKKH